MYCHLLWPKESQSDSFTEFCWVDTRHMTADGQTKGSIDREVVIQVSHGNPVRTHAPKALRKKGATHQQTIDTPTSPSEHAVNAAVFFLITADS